MKIKQYFILIIVAIAIFGCSEDEEYNPISIASISYTLSDGTALSENECINPNMKYAIKIETTSKSPTKGIPLRVDYSVNGVVFTMNFSVSGAQINPVTLADGNNVAQIIGSDYKCSLQYSSQGDFVLVE